MRTPVESSQARLSHAALLVELGWTHDAELEVAEVVDRDPADLDALSLLAKIKHIRGELSQAIACWAQLHARAPGDDGALVELRALLALAEDPERGASEFLAVGHHRLIRKPAGHLALEEAFALLRAHQPDEARARCIEIAARYRGRDRHTYKLAILAVAWIAELSGQLEEAARFLERLGHERGFDRDTDRLIALARIYEQLATPERLRATIRIYRSLDQQLGNGRAERISLLGRMAALHAHLGDQKQAEELERRHLTAFLRRNHRPTFADAVRVAARRYVPLSRLVKLRLPPPRPHDKGRRTRALAAALEGERGRARALFEESRDRALDREYLADLIALGGDEDEAARHYLSALADDPHNVHVVGWLLEYATRRRTPEVEAYFRSEAGFAAARECLETTAARAPRRPSVWRHLALLLELADSADEAKRCRDNADRLASAARRKSQAVGRILSASVYHFIGRAKGLIHEIWAHRYAVEPGTGGILRPDQILGNLTDEMKEGVRNVFLAVREYALAVFPHRAREIPDYGYTFKVPKEDEPSGGLSAGLPSALVFLSVFLQRPIPQDVAFTGMVVADAHDVLTVRRVSEIDYKVKAAYNRNLRALLVPTANRPELEASTEVPAPIRRDLVRYVSNLDEAIRQIWGPDGLIG